MRMEIQKQVHRMNLEEEEKKYKKMVPFGNICHKDGEIKINPSKMTRFVYKYRNIKKWIKDNPKKSIIIGTITFVSIMIGLPLIFGVTTKYWVGGTGSWSQTAHWSGSSGGAGGVPKPINDDDVVIDSNSGMPTITLDENTANLDNFTMSAGTLNCGSNNFTCEEVFTLGNGTFNCNTGTHVLGYAADGTNACVVSGGTLNGNSAYIVSGGMRMTSGAITGTSDSWNIYTLGNSSYGWYVTGGTFTHNSGTVLMAMRLARLDMDATFGSFNNLTASGANKEIIWWDNDLTVSGTLRCKSQGEFMIWTNAESYTLTIGTLQIDANSKANFGWGLGSGTKAVINIIG